MSLIRMRRRYLSLGLGELTAALVFVLVAYQSSARIDGLALWSALVPLAFILIQAGCYWLLARQWVGAGTMPGPIARAFRVLQVVNPFMLILGIIGVVSWFPRNPGTAALVLLVWLFGVAEYCNYFVVRLAYPVTHWGSELWKRRTPQLMQDLRSSEAAP